jgi:RNA polymerase sigma-70 factor (ECF subfamily)
MAMRPFEEVIEHNGRALLSYCASRVGSDRAEDCFQETMLAAPRVYDGLKDERAVRSWLFRIAGNKAIDMPRQSSREPSSKEHIDSVRDPATGNGPGSAEIWSVVDHLPDKQAVAVMLRRRGGLSHREVGEAMEISESAARRNVFEGLKTLRADRQSWL